MVFDVMKTNRLFFSLGFAAVVAASFGQTATTRLVELQREPSAEIQQSIPVGFKSGSDVLHLAVSLPVANPAGLQQFADAVSNPHSPMYRHFIGPDEVGQRFGLPAFRVQRIINYLESQGMSVTLVGKNHFSILAEATVAQAEAAFHTSIQNFQTAKAGVRFSFTIAPSVPADIAGDVLDISGMDSFTRPLGHTALTASQLQSIYSASSLYSGGGKQGAGRTIGISNFDGFRLSNIPLELTLQSLPAPAAGAGSNVTVTPVSGGTGQTGTASGEGDLDIQAVLSIAPLSNVIVYDNYTTTGNDPIGVLTKEASDNTADIITESYGWQLSTGTALAAHNLHLSMTAQGITYLASSGDHGTTWVSGTANYNYPATDPEVLSVGGTSATVTTTGTRSTEVGWNSLGMSGGGGWNVTTDTFNTRPSYQSTPTFLAGPGVPNLTSVPYRLVPDIAFDADPNTGYLIYVNGAKAQYGGTSASSPCFAGLLALLEDQLIADGALVANGSKFRMGRIQDLLYSYNGNSSVFFDVTSGTNGTLPNGKVSNAGPGWDTDSGWGPIIMTGLLAQIEKGVSSLTLAPASITGGSTSTGTVTLQVAAPTGGAVVSLASSNTSVASVPASVTVAAGATSATFTVTSLAVTAAQTSTITATYNNVPRTAVVTVSPISVSSVTLSPTSVAGGVSSTGTVTLTTAAPSTGFVVNLKSSSTSATVPASVTVAAGSTTATFTVSTVAVAASTSSTITASSGSASATVALAITAPTLSKLSLSPASVVGGVASTGTVTLTGAAPTGGMVVSLKSSATSATVPSSVTVAAGATTATFSVATTAVSANTSATITATQGTLSASVALTVTPPTVASVKLSATSVVGGSNAVITGTVTLSGAAGPSGTVVTLSSSSTTSATLPVSVTVPAGATSATFSVTHLVVTKAATVKVKGTSGTSSQSATLTVNPFAISTFTLSPTSVKGGASSTGTVTLNATPVSAITVTLKSSSTSATVAASFSIAAGSATGTFAITTKAVTANTTSTITTTVGSGSKTATLTITP